MANAQSKDRPKPSPSSATLLAASTAPKPSGLTTSAKYALLGGVLILVIVLGLALFGSSGNDPQAFTNYLYSNHQSGIIMDVRGSPSQNVTTKILQCGVNLISSGFYARTNKDLLVYACDNTGCLAAGANTTSNTTADQTLSYSDVLYNMRGRAYFHILPGPTGQQVFHGNYAEVFINEETDPTCSIGIN